MTRHWVWLLPIGAALVLRLAGSADRFPSVPGLGPAPATWWWVTTAVAVVSALGAFRLMRALGVQGGLLPAALVIGSTGVGVLAARGADGPSTAGFGMEPLALCLLIWCYDAVARGHAVRAGVLLGAAGLAHPLALAHGLVVVGIATAFAGGDRWRRGGITAAIALAAGAPAVVRLALGAVDLARLDAAAGERLVTEGYLFRFPSSYTLLGSLGAEGIGRIALVLAGIAGAVALIRAGREGAARAVAGLIAGHTVLALLAVLCYTGLLPGPWNRSVTAYALDLTLTASLLPLLCGIAIFAAIEAQLTAERSGGVGPRVLRLGLWVAAAAILLTLDWTLAHLLAVALGIAALVAVKAGRGQRLAGLVLATSALVAATWGARRDAASAPLDRADAELYEWARGTPKRTSFIVPPTARGFRFHTRKGVYVDYDLVPPASPRAMRMWRDRLDRVARPDARIRTVAAWLRPYAMDRAYALANTPAGTAKLLSELKEDYLVWDARGLEIPPHLPIDRPPDRRVVEAFRNERYVVYRLAEGQRPTP